MFFFHVQGIVRSIRLKVLCCADGHRFVQYNIASLIFSWFALANLWLTFSIIIRLLPSEHSPVYLFGTRTVVRNGSFSMAHSELKLCRRTG